MKRMLPLIFGVGLTLLTLPVFAYANVFPAPRTESCAIALNGEKGTFNAEELQLANVSAASGTAAAIENIIPRGALNPSAPRFTGVSYMNLLHANDEATGIPGMGQVTFEPCARTDWHYHDGGQILLVTEGAGVLGFEGERARLMQPGDVIFIEPGKIHFHAAMPDSWFAHIAVSTNPSCGKTNWLEKVSAKEYLQAVTKATGEGTLRTKGKTMFEQGKRFTADGSSGVWRQNRLVATEEVFNCPEINYFSLEANSHSAWHSHPSGQFIILTNGAGVYQENGGQVKNLKAGDVMSVPANILHYIGTTNETLAFIAVNGKAAGKIVLQKEIKE